MFVLLLVVVVVVVAVDVGVAHVVGVVLHMLLLLRWRFDVRCVAHWRISLIV